MDPSMDRVIPRPHRDANRHERCILGARGDVRLWDLREPVEEVQRRAVGILGGHDQSVIRQDDIRSLRIDGPDVADPGRPAEVDGHVAVEDVPESSDRRFRALPVVNT